MYKEVISLSNINKQEALFGNLVRESWLKLNCTQ